MTAKRATAQPGKEAHGLYMFEKYERIIEYFYPIAQSIPRKQRRKLSLMLKHHEHDAWKRSQISWMGHLRYSDGYNALKSLGLAPS